MKCHFTTTSISRGRREEKELTYCVDGSVKCYSCYEKQPANTYKIKLYIHMWVCIYI